MCPDDLEATDLPNAKMFQTLGWRGIHTLSDRNRREVTVESMAGDKIAKLPLRSFLELAISGESDRLPSPQG